MDVSTGILESIPALTNHEIERKMKKLTKYFIGVYDNDSLPEDSFVYPFAFIANTLKDTDPTVGHWVAFVFDRRGKGHYFDSYGAQPPYIQWRRYLRNRSHHNTYSYSSIIVQSYNSNGCGYLCMDYILRRLKYPRLGDNQIARHLDEYKSFKRLKDK